MTFPVLFVGLFPALQAHGQPKRELHVASAADMHPVFDILAPMFEKKTGIHLVISYASSSVLAQQLQNGSPADIFFSADYYFAEQVVAAGLTDNKTPTLYARGKLVLWTRKGTPFNPPSITMVEENKFQSLSIANPDHAPYGRAAVAALQKLNVYNAVKPHLLQADNVMQAAQFAQSGNAQGALISETIASSPAFRATGSYVLVPTYIYPDIRQCAVIMKNSHQRDAAHQLLDYILSPQIQGNLHKVGLDAAN